MRRTFLILALASLLPIGGLAHADDDDDDDKGGRSRRRGGSPPRAARWDRDQEDYWEKIEERRRDDAERFEKRQREDEKRAREQWRDAQKRAEERAREDAKRSREAERDVDRYNSSRPEYRGVPYGQGYAYPPIVDQVSPYDPSSGYRPTTDRGNDRDYDPGQSDLQPSYRSDPSYVSPYDLRGGSYTPARTYGGYPGPVVRPYTITVQPRSY